MNVLDVLTALGLQNDPGAVSVSPDHTPYSGMILSTDENAQSVTLPSGTNLDEPLSFVTQSVVIDNNTSNYMCIVDGQTDGAGRFLAPGQGGVFPIFGRMHRARITWTAPPGKVQPGFVAGEMAQLTFWSTPVGPGFGYAAPSPNTLPWVSPNQPAKLIGEVIGATSDSAFSIPGIAGKQIYLFYLSISFDVAVAGQAVTLERISDSAQLWQFPTAVQVPNPLQGFGTVICPLGDGLKLHNFAGSAVTVRGGCVYSQA